MVSLGAALLFWPNAGLEPAFQILADQAGQGRDVVLFIVEARDVEEVFAACFFEAFGNFLINFFKSFNTIARE